jgi:hypothetical protein
MSRLLRRIGLGIWLATIWLAVGQLAGLVPASLADVWLWRGIWAGAATLAAGFLLGGIGLFSQELRRGRCVRCGARIERNQTYCRDHLQATVNEYRDRQHTLSA